MSIKSTGLILIGVGVAVFFGGGGLPNQGVIKFKKLVSAYRVEKEEGREPTIEQKGAYYTYWSYLVGSGLVAIGLFVMLIAFLLEG